MVLDATAAVINAPEVDRDGYKTAAIAELQASEVTGAVVYDINDERVGEIHDFIMETDAKIAAAILDIGGFLGMGEKQVAVSMDSLTFKKAEDGEDLRIYVDVEEADFDKMQEWKDKG